MRLRTPLLAAALALTAAATDAAAQSSVQIEPGALDVPRGDLFIRGLDALWTANGQVHENVSVVVRDGVIRAIGAGLSAPSGATVIDGKGMTAIPGLVDEHSHIAMGGGSNEGTAPVVSEVRVIDTLDPEDYGIYQALSGGVTTAQILHGSANPIGGQSAVIKTRWGVDDARDLLLEGAPRFIKFALGENVTQKNWSSPIPRFPASREGVEALYVEAFTAAQDYKKAWDDYRKNPKAHRVAPRKDLRLEALVDILAGRLKVTAHSYRSDEIVMLMRIAERFGFRINGFTHVLEGYKVADEIARHGAAASTFSDWWMYKLEAYDAIPYNAAIMHEHGVLTSLNSDIPWLQSFMVYEFNKPVKYGDVSREDALRMLTRYPAEELKIADKVGTLEVGKQADIVLLSGDPFDTYSRVEKTIIDGVVYYDRAHDAELRGRPVRPLPPIPAPPTRPVVAQQATPAAAFAYAPDGGQVTALVGATVHPVSAPEIPNGVVLVQGGKVVAVGPASQVQVPAGAERIDVTGKHVYPGMIDPLTQLGMVEVGSFNAARDDREVGRMNPHLRGLAGVHPHSEVIPVTRANGITAVLAVQQTGTVNGMGSVIQLDGDTPERMEVEDRAALVVDFPRPKGEAWDEPKLEGERIEELVSLFERARLYASQPSVRRDPTAPFEANVWGNDKVMLEAMTPVIRGEIPVIFKARTERDIRSLLLFLDKFPEVKAVLAGGDQAYRVAGELAKRSIPVIVGSGLVPTMDEDDPVVAGWANAAILHGNGVRVAFTTQWTDDGVSQIRNLPYAAARSAAFGLPREEALRAVTLNAAEILGLGDVMGSIEVGKRADLIVTDGDPLQIVTKVERMLIGGTEVSLESRHTRLYEEFKDRH